jgi:hypothetical protein
MSAQSGRRTVDTTCTAATEESDDHDGRPYTTRRRLQVGWKRTERAWTQGVGMNAPRNTEGKAMAISFPAHETAVDRQSQRYWLLRLRFRSRRTRRGSPQPEIATPISPIGTDLAALAPLFGPGASIDHLSSNLH